MSINLLRNCKKIKNKKTVDFAIDFLSHEMWTFYINICTSMVTLHDNMPLLVYPKPNHPKHDGCCCRKKLKSYRSQKEIRKTKTRRVTKSIQMCFCVLKFFLVNLLTSLRPCNLVTLTLSSIYLFIYRHL